MEKILIIDPTGRLHETLKMVLKNRYSLSTATSREEVASFIKVETFDLLVIGLAESSARNLDLLDLIGREARGTAILLIGDEAQLGQEKSIISGPLIDTLLKPFTIYTLQDKVRALLNKRSASTFKTQQVSERYKGLLNYSKKIEPEARRVIQGALNNNAPVLIIGEPGTPKELVGRIIHYNGPQSKRAFIKLNCRTSQDLPAEIGEAGTLFIEDIEKMGPGLQNKLFEILEENRGEIRLITTSSIDLKERAYQLNFPDTLLYRLDIIPLRLLPLRDRTRDIPDIINEVMEERCLSMRLERRQLSKEAVQCLLNYYWPGNLLELEGVISRSIAISTSRVLLKEDIIFDFEEKRSLPLKEGSSVEVGVSDELRPDPIDLLLAELAHEVKNPLVAIKTFTQLLSDRFDDPNFRNNFYQLVKQDVDRINNLIEGLLTYTKIKEPVFKRKRIDNTIDEILEEKTELLKEKGIEVIRDFDRDLPEITMDEDQIKYALTNILAKAINTMEGGLIYIRAKSSDVNREDQRGKNVDITISYPEGERDLTALGTDLKGLEISLSQRVIERNQGKMTAENVDGKRQINLSIPVDAHLIVFLEKSEERKIFTHTDEEKPKKIIMFYDRRHKLAPIDFPDRRKKVEFDKI